MVPAWAASIFANFLDLPAMAGVRDRTRLG
jgi:hypothetical protein